MTGVELYIKDKNGKFYCYKQRHDGYLITYFVERIGKPILFCMSAKQIIKEFHDKFFKDESEGNFHPNGSPLEYGVEIPAQAVKHEKFSDVFGTKCIYTDIEDYIYKNFRDDNDWKNDYVCGYGDYIIYIDLIKKEIIVGLEDEDEEDNDEEDNGFND